MDTLNFVLYEISTSVLTRPTRRNIPEDGILELIMDRIAQVTFAVSFYSWRSFRINVHRQSVVSNTINERKKRSL
jgi:hypothetical protein